jgi:hypothetical protein
METAYDEPERNIEMAFTYRETQVVKGMLLRGDKQHDIAAYFGVNGGRVAEVATGKCDYPSAPPLPLDQLPPPGPYLSVRSVVAIKAILDEALRAIDAIGGPSQEARLAREALQAAMRRLQVP